MWFLTLLLGILVVLSITAVTGYFVAQEFAYMAVDRSRLTALAERGDASAARALTVTRRTSFMLSGAQLGITVTGLLVGYVAEPLIGEALGEAFGSAGVPAAVAIGAGTVLALLFSTLVQMVFGELFPKNLAIARPDPVARRLATSTTAYLTVFGWLISIFDHASNALLRLLRIEPVHDVEHSATVRDLEHIVADSRASGDLPEDLSILLDRILDFPGRDAGHAMIPRSAVDVLRPSDSLARIRQLMARGHSRYPVLTADDDIAGVVHLQDVLALPASSEAGTTAAELMRPAVLVPSTMSLPDVLLALGSGTNQLACVVNEYGGFDGVITVEDLAEELVGEITDEHDSESVPDAAPAGDGSWIMAGDVHVDEAERTIGYDLPRGDHETLAGLVIAVHGRLPDAGTVVSIELSGAPSHGVRSDDAHPLVTSVTVLSLRRHVPARLRITAPVRLQPGMEVQS